MHHQATELVDPGSTHFQMVHVKGVYGTHTYMYMTHTIHDYCRTQPTDFLKMNTKDGLKKCVHIPGAVTIIRKSVMSTQIISNYDIVQ